MWSKVVHGETLSLSHTHTHTYIHIEVHMHTHSQMRDTDFLWQRTGMRRDVVRMVTFTYSLV